MEIQAAVKKEKEFKAKELEKMRFIEAQRSEKIVQLEKTLKENEKREDAAADIWLAQPQQRRDDYDAKCTVSASHDYPNKTPSSSLCSNIKLTPTFPHPISLKNVTSISSNVVEGLKLF